MLRRAAAILRFQFVAANASSIAFSSVWSFELRTSDFSPPFVDAALVTEGLTMVLGRLLSSNSEIASFSSCNTRNRFTKLPSSRRLPGQRYLRHAATRLWE